MSETDSFIDEVTEAVRQDKLWAAFRKWGWIGGVVIATVVGGTAWNAWQTGTAQKNARAFGDRLMAAVQARDTGKELAGITANGTGRATLLRIMQGDQAASTGDFKAALAFYNEAASEPGQPTSITDLAKLKSVIIAGDAMDAGTRDATLAALARPGAPYRLLAMEQQANVKLAAGDKPGAIDIAKQILQAAGLTPGLQQRTTELIVALGGEVPPMPDRLMSARQ